MYCPHCGSRGWLFTEPGPGQERWRVCVNCGYEEFTGDSQPIQRTRQRLARKPTRQLDPGEWEWD